MFRMPEGECYCDCMVQSQLIATKNIKLSGYFVTARLGFLEAVTTELDPLKLLKLLARQDPESQHRQ